jgi:WD40-like Beta Propeller Repeat
MSTRATSLPIPWLRHRHVRVRNPAPVVGVLVVFVAVASLATALGRLPADVSAPRSDRLVGLAALQPPGSLDTIAGIEETAWPRSRYPVGGFAFVRCTNLWTAHADGSGARRILSMPGISSPTFSPDGRTIAFLAASQTGTDIWLAAADGSVTRRLGTIASDGEPVLTNAGPLAWSPDGTRLAFSLMPAGIRGGTPSHWALRLDAGMFDPIGEGGDEPVWLGRQVLVAGRDDGGVENLWGDRWTARRLSKVGDVEALAFAPGWWAWEWEKQTAVLVDDGDELALSWQNRPWGIGSDLSTLPPAGYAFDPGSGLAVLQHGTVAVTLLDEDGERDLGLYDPSSLTWTTLDYAWDAAGSPAPAVIGSVEEQRAVQLAQDLLWSLGRPDRVHADLLLAEPVHPGLLPFRHVGYAIDDPVREGGAWTIPAHTYGRMGAAVGTRDVAVTVRDVDGRLAATLTAAGPIVRLRTVGDAARYLDRVLTVPVIAPAGLPEGTRLAERWGVEAWSWRGRTTGSLHLIAPGIGRMSFFYGDGGLGCGAYPVPLELETGTHAIVQDPEMSGGYNAIAWPAEPKDTSGPFGISANTSTETLVAIATAMDASRRSTSAG